MRLLISDLGAKNHMLNMFKFNGFYGCHFCETKVKTIEKTHAYYPFIETGRVRESHLTENYVNMAEAQNADELPNVVGVKGRSPFSEIIAGLPLTAPVDYMHCVLLGAFPELLNVYHKLLTAQDKKKCQRFSQEFVMSARNGLVLKENQMPGRTKSVQSE